MSRDNALVKSEPQALAQPATRARLVVAPACDVYENRDEVLVLADLPGVTADALDIQLDRGELAIRARRAVTAGEGAPLAAELRDGDFSRRFAVPGTIDAAKITAELKDGVLWLHLPKSDAHRPRQIAVRAG